MQELEQAEQALRAAADAVRAAMEQTRAAREALQKARETQQAYPRARYGIEYEVYDPDRAEWRPVPTGSVDQVRAGIRAGQWPGARMRRRQVGAWTEGVTP